MQSWRTQEFRYKTLTLYDLCYECFALAADGRDAEAITAEGSDSSEDDSRS